LRLSTCQATVKSVLIYRAGVDVKSSLFYSLYHILRLQFRAFYLQQLIGMIGIYGPLLQPLYVIQETCNRAYAIAAVDIGFKLKL
jgi:hypothetical protein